MRVCGAYFQLCTKSLEGDAMNSEELLCKRLKWS
jgi:hypothetical protein